METVKSDPHKAQWERLYEKNMKLSKEKNDIYYNRAESCKRLLAEYC